MNKATENIVSLKAFFALSRFRAFVLSCFLLLANPISAQETDTIQVHTIDEVIITERRVSAEVRSVAPLQMLTSERISRLNVLQVSDAVKHFSGVMVRDYGGIGGLKTVSVRSLGANHTAINYNGILLSDVQTGQIDIGRFSIDNIESISLNSGQNDNIFLPARSFASASVLNIRTRRPVFEDDRRINGRTTLRTGSFGLVNPSLNLNAKINSNISALFSGEYMYAHGEYPFKFRYGTGANDSTEILRRQNTDVRNLRLETMFFGNFAERGTAHIKTFFYNSERGLPGNVTFYNPLQNSQQRLWERNFFTQAHFRRELSHNLSFQTNGKYNWSWMRYVDAGTLSSAGILENTYSQQEFYLSTSFLYRAFEQLSFSFSTDGFINTMESDLVNFAYPTRYSLLSVIAAKYVNNRILATASLLNTLVTERVQFGALPENHNHFSPYIGISVKPFLAHDLRLRAFYKNIFRLPTFNDLYFTNIGNTNLKPETTNQYNVGITYTTSVGSHIPFFNITLDAYHNNVQNKIVALPSKRDIFLWTMLNFGEVSTHGIDLNVETHIQPSENLGVILGVSHSYQRALNVTDPTNRFTFGHQIPYTPRVSGAVRAGIETRWVNIFYSLVWSGHRYVLPQNYTANRLEGYRDHSISLSRNFNLSFGQLSANLELLNLTDENYQVVRGFPMPGRSFRISTGLSF